MKPRVYIFGWPSVLGGADTKLAHLVVLLHDDFDLTVVPNDIRHLAEKVWTDHLDRCDVNYAVMEALPAKLEGVALSMSNWPFFTHRFAHRAKEQGLRVVWSSEMMWHHPGELEAVREGVVDKVLYVSEVQRTALEPGYRDVGSEKAGRQIAAPAVLGNPSSKRADNGCYPNGLRWAMTGNYIDPSFFPFQERGTGMFTIGRLSRPDPLKYPEDFPVFYECLGLPETRFRVMAWSEELAAKYRWHRFDARWELLPAQQETQVDFLHSLDLFVYPLGHKFVESWGRSTVEAMLTGAVPLVPGGHHLDSLIVHGETGFICHDFLEWKEHAHRLQQDRALRVCMARQSRAHAEHTICNREEHLKIWREALTVLPP